MERLTREETIVVRGKEMAACNYENDDCNDSCRYGRCRWQEKANMLLKKYEDTGLTPPQIMELKERDKPKQVVYEHEFEDNRLISYVQRCKSCGGAYDTSERFNFCPNCGQRILRRKVIVKAFANYGFAGIEMEFEEEFPDNATDEEIEETMKDIVYEQVDWSWRKED